MTDNYYVDTYPTETPWTEAVSSAGFTKLSVATLLLTGLTVAFIL